MGHVAGKRENRNVHRVLVGKPESKRLLGTPKGKWKHIKIIIIIIWLIRSWPAC
jgi:hypothetical protein